MELLTKTQFLAKLKYHKPASVRIVTTSESVEITTADEKRNRWLAVLETVQTIGAEEIKRIDFLADSGEVLVSTPGISAETLLDAVPDEPAASPIFSGDRLAETSTEMSFERVAGILIQAQTANMELHYRLLNPLISGFQKQVEILSERQVRIERMQSDSIDRLIQAVQVEADAAQGDTISRLAEALAPALLPLIGGFQQNNGENQ